MRFLLTEGLFSWMVILWSILSLILIFIMFVRSPKHILVILGTLLGSIIFLIGITGLFSSINRAFITIGNMASVDITSVVQEGASKAKVPFYFGTIATIIFFCILSVLTIVKKGIFKKWSIWIASFIFIFSTLLLTFARQSMNINLAKAIGKFAALESTIPELIYPFIKAGRLAVFTALSLSIVYFLVTILVTIRNLHHSPRTNLTGK